MTLQDIITHFLQEKTSISEKNEYSDLPGIYALFFIGEDFLIKNYQIPDHQIVYIGKTLRSQKNRNANTHFKTGETGSSTVRKSIGSLLSQFEKMNPIIRSQTDVAKNRKSHFKFDWPSEEKITKWMDANLAVSFFEYPNGKKEIKALEEELIKAACPVLNLSGNSENRYKALIQRLRKQMGIKAHEGFLKMKEKESIRKPKHEILFEPLRPAQRAKHKYAPIWEYYLKDVKKGLQKTNSKLVLDRKALEKVGNRKKYSFKIEFLNGRVVNNIKGSAVARDLVKTLEEHKVKTGNKVIRMGKDFVLSIEKS